MAYELRLFRQIEVDGNRGAAGYSQRQTPLKLLGQNIDVAVFVIDQVSRDPFQRPEPIDGFEGIYLLPSHRQHGRVAAQRRTFEARGIEAAIMMDDTKIERPAPHRVEDLGGPEFEQPEFHPRLTLPERGHDAGDVRTRHRRGHAYQKPPA